jgi:hypothetical protein
VERLDNRYPFFLTYFVDGRRYHRKGVMNMNNFWSEFPEDAAYSHFAVAGGNDPAD